MKQSFRIYLYPISVNSFYTGDKRHKSTAAREWTLEAFNQLNQTYILEKMKSLRDFFDPKKHSYQINLVVAYPKSIFKTKQGTISSKTIDITNWEKSIVDVLFLSKFFDDFNNLNTDDKYLTEMSSKKIQGSDENYYIDIEIIINNLD